MVDNLFHKFWLWFHSLLRTSFYWLSKLVMSGGTRMRRRLLKVREKKSLVKIGRRIQELHQSGESDWPGDSKVKEIIQELEDSCRKREELKSRLQERKDRFREKVRKLKEKGAESAAEGDE